MAVFAAAALCPALVAGGLVYAVDPYQHFRAGDRFLAEGRYLAPGIARHRDYEAVVIGNSMAANFLNATLSRVLGLKTQNLSVNGSSYWEQRRVLDLALATHPVREVVWVVHPLARGGTSVLGDDFPLYLYDDDPRNDLDYLFNRDMLLESWRILRDPDYGRDDPELFYSWYRRPDHQPGRDQVRAGYRRFAYPDEADLRLMEADFGYNVVDGVRRHPDTHFTMFLAPFSGLFYIMTARRHPEVYQTLLAYRRHVLRALSAEPNVTLLDFSAVPSLVLDLDNYWNVLHYGLPASDWIAARLRSVDHVVTPANADAVADRLPALIEGAARSALAERGAAPGADGSGPP